MPVEIVPERVRVPAPPRAHACFRLDSAIPFDLSAERDVLDLWARLSYRVIREPGDLLAHSRRVLLCRRSALLERLPAALLDLDHATEGRGHALRRRLLGIVRPQLSAEHGAWFDALLEGVPPTGAAPGGPGRVLPSLGSVRGASDHGVVDRE